VFVENKAEVASRVVILSEEFCVFGKLLIQCSQKEI